MIVAEQQRVESRTSRRRGDLEHVARLLRRIERAHRAFDEAARRHRVERALEQRVGLRPGRIQKPQRGAQLHRGLTECIAIGDSPLPEPTSPLIVAARPASIDVAAAVCAGAAVHRLRSELHRPFDPQHPGATDQGRPRPVRLADRPDGRHRVRVVLHAFGIPIARLADTHNRRNIIAVLPRGVERDDGRLRPCAEFLAAAARARRRRGGRSRRQSAGAFDDLGSVRVGPARHGARPLRARHSGRHHARQSARRMDQRSDGLAHRLRRRSAFPVCSWRWCCASR